MPQRIVLLRHGRTDYNVRGLVQGQIDIPLDEVGRAQVIAAAKILAIDPPNMIISSDLSRAMDTAQALSDICEVPVIPDKRLRERFFGEFEGLSVAEMERSWPEEFAQWRSTGESRRVGIENRRVVGERIATTIREYLAQMGEDEQLLVVAHGSAFIQGVETLMGLDPSQWFGLRGLDNSHWAELVAGDRHPKWKLTKYNMGAAKITFPENDCPADNGNSAKK